MTSPYWRWSPWFSHNRLKEAPAKENSALVTSPFRLLFSLWLTSTQGQKWFHCNESMILIPYWVPNLFTFAVSMVEPPEDEIQLRFNVTFPILASGPNTPTKIRCSLYYYQPNFENFPSRSFQSSSHPELSFQSASLITTQMYAIFDKRLWVIRRYKWKQGLLAFNPRNEVLELI